MRFKDKKQHERKEKKAERDEIRLQIKVSRLAKVSGEDWATKQHKGDYLCIQQ